MNKHLFLQKLQNINEELGDLLAEFPEDLEGVDYEEVEGASQVLELVYDKVAQQVANEGD